jgi:hypothetical protein
MIAAGAGVVLVISPFLDWYSVSAKNSIVSFSISGSGWDTLSWVPWLVTITGLVAIAFAAARASGTTLPNLPASPGFIVLVLGALSTLFVLFRLVSTPDAGTSSSLVDISRSFGIFLAFLAAIGVTVGAWLTWNEEGKPKPGGTGVGVGGPAGAPLGQGQPPYGGQAPYAGQPPAAQQPQQQAYVPPAATAAQPQQAAPAAGAAKADWYPDPRGEKRLRYWDGSQWTDHTAD